MTTVREKAQNRSTIHLLIALTIIAIAVQFLEQPMLSRVGTLAVLVGAWCRGLSLINGKKWLGYVAWAGFGMFVLITLYTMVERLIHGA